MTIDHLKDMIAEFVSGSRIDLQFAGTLETALDDLFPEDEYVRDTVLMLAAYRPGGGEFLYDEDAIKRRLQKTAQYLDDLKRSGTPD